MALVDVLHGFLGVADNAYRNDLIKILRVPIILRRRHDTSIRSESFSIAAHLATRFRKVIQNHGQDAVGDVSVNNQRLRGSANARTPHLGVDDHGARHVEIGLGDGSFGTILLEDLKWARQWLEGEKLGPTVKSAADVLQAGTVIVVEEITNGAATSTLADSRYTLRQIPEVEGALIAMDGHIST